MGCGCRLFPLMCKYDEHTERTQSGQRRRLRCGVHDGGQGRRRAGEARAIHDRRQERSAHGDRRRARRTRRRDRRRERAGHATGLRRWHGRRQARPPQVRCDAHRRVGERHAPRRDTAGPCRTGRAWVRGAERPAPAAGARTDGCHRHDLRGPSERDRRRHRIMRQIRQCGDPARRSCGGAHERRDARDRQGHAA